MLKLYNTLTRKKEDFEPLEKGKVRMYSCGPTVYDYAHIGNLRAYLSSDILRRYLEFSGYKVKQIMNLTDVDDKTIKRSIAEGIKLKGLTEKYAKAFFEDLKILNIQPAEKYPKATEHIKDMIKHINLLLQKKIAYLSKDGSIYYDISKFKSYGKLSGIKVKELKEGASKRVSKDEYDKENAQDFALWKGWSSDDGEVFWNAEFLIDVNTQKSEISGAPKSKTPLWRKQIVKGRPGWHIECSAMSSKYLGEQFDIHSGGQDLIFPHHENEIAQSEAVTGKQFVKYWFHNGWLLVEGKKMSKSLGNFFTLRDLLKETPNARPIRYILMSVHYREPLDFTFEKFRAAEQTLKRIDNFIERVKSIKAKTENRTAEILIKNLESNVREALDNDLDIPGSFGYLFNFIREINSLIEKNELSEKQAKETIKLFEKLDKIYGVLISEEKTDVPKEVLELAREREKARKAKDWKKSDELRDKIKELGFSVKDTPERYILTKI
jgi:cysteinyl-tRNA synthetase